MAYTSAVVKKNLKYVNKGNANYEDYSVSLLASVWKAKYDMDGLQDKAKPFSPIN